MEMAALSESCGWDLMICGRDCSCIDPTDHTCIDDSNRELDALAAGLRLSGVPSVRSVLLLLQCRAMFLIKPLLPSDVSRTDYSF
jgi:hypothetical protein